MKEIKCPYCCTVQEVDQSNGFHHLEKHDQNCLGCGKTFKFLVRIEFSALCQDGDHVLLPPEFPYSTFVDCANCDHIEPVNMSTGSQMP